MWQRFQQLFLYEIPADFLSAYDLRTSVQRLRASSHRTALTTLFREGLVGSVTEESVRLHRVRPFFHNDLRPVFAGTFEVSEGVVTLRGSFRMSQWTRGFLMFWFGFAALWSLLALALSFGDSKTWWLPFAGIGMIAAGVGFVALAKTLSSGDVAWLSARIGDNLGVVGSRRHDL